MRSGQGSNRRMPADDQRRDPISPGELVRRMPEGEGAGPDAPETDEPTQGRPGAGGHGSQGGPGGPAPLGIGDPVPDGARGADADSRPDAAGAAGALARFAVLGLGRLAHKARGRSAPSP